MFSLACFNVFSHNRDDHAKNFSYIYDDDDDDDERDLWCMSPAYDLTYSTTYYGKHTTSVNGNGADPGVNELMELAAKNRIKKDKAINIIEEVYYKTDNDLKKYLKK